MTSLNMNFRAGFLEINSLNLCLFEKGFFSFTFKGQFHKIQNFMRVSFFFSLSSYFKYFYSLLAYMTSKEKTDLILTSALLYIKLFSSGSSQEFSFISELIKFKYDMGRCSYFGIYPA